jgi:hypothetical protein
MNDSRRMILNLRREGTKLAKILPAALSPTVRQQGLTVRGVHYNIVLKSRFAQEPDCYADTGLQN